MEKLLIVINTCFRYRQLTELLNQINQYSEQYDITINLHNDGSPVYMEPYIQDAIESCEGLKINYSSNQDSHTKIHYWKLVTKNIKQVIEVSSKEDFDYYFFLPDDAVLCSEYFDKAIHQWNLIDDPKKICLNLFADTIRLGKYNWGFTPTQVEFSGVKMFNTGWVDLEFISSREFFDVLSRQAINVPLDRWRTNPYLGSGVGQVISKILSGMNYSLYQVSESLSWQSSDESVMNFNRPFSIIPVIDLKTDPVIVSIATQKSRFSSICETIRSLQDNTTKPDIIKIYINDTDEVPILDKQYDNMIFVNRPLGDLADNGKFYGDAGNKCYHFKCDDDISYPVDYISYLVSQIEINKRQAVVGLHGVIIPKKNIDSYYKDRVTHHCMREVRKHTSVHLIATGCCAYHSDTFQACLTDFKTKYMADIWFSLALQKVNIPMICLSHRDKYLLDLDKPGIWQEFVNKDEMQTKVINDNDWSLSNIVNEMPKLKCKIA